MCLFEDFNQKGKKKKDSARPIIKFNRVRVWHWLTYSSHLLTNKQNIFNSKNIVLHIREKKQTELENKTKQNACILQVQVQDAISEKK